MKKAQRQWTNADSALWQTCRRAWELETGRTSSAPPIATYFPLQPGEVAWATGPLVIDEFRTAGDGTYQRSTFLAGGTGTFGLALLAATAAGSAIGNSNRRARAAADAAEAWRPCTRGSVVVTDGGFYIQDMRGVFRWDWNSIDLMQVAAFSTIVMQGQSDRGPVMWRLFSDWAELIFVGWAHARHRQHPQYLSGQWLPAGWQEWVAAQGYPLEFGSDSRAVGDR